MPHQNPPLKRHEALAPFSRDHYTGLVQAQHLKKAAVDDDAARRKATADFVDAWDHELLPHIEDEEAMLAEHLSGEDRTQFYAAHEKLRTLATEMRGQRRQTDPDPEVLLKVGRELEEHIRWEERELFQRLQTQLPEHTLEALQLRTAPIESRRRRDVSR